MFAKATEDLPEDLPLSDPSPLPSEPDLSSEHASDELVDLPEDLPLLQEERRSFPLGL